LQEKIGKVLGMLQLRDIWFGIKDKLGATEFLGYESNQAEGDGFITY
jgi:alanyl-tRNA synthetase